MTRALALGLALAWLSGGCGASARDVLSAQASVLVSSQAARVSWYGSEHERCSVAEDLDAYRACMAPSRHVARAVDSYRDSLRAADAAVQAGERPMCVAEAAARLVEALSAANAPIPAEILSFASAVDLGCSNE